MSFKDSGGFSRGRVNATTRNVPASSQQFYFNIPEEENYGGGSLDAGIMSRSTNSPLMREEECVGFTVKAETMDESFRLKGMQLQLRDNKLKSLTVSMRCIIAITETNTILRWKFDK